MTALKIHRENKPTQRYTPLLPMTEDDRLFWLLMRDKRPRIAALRQHIHGPLQPLETKRAPWWQRALGRGT